MRAGTHQPPLWLLLAARSGGVVPRSPSRHPSQPSSPLTLHLTSCAQPPGTPAAVRTMRSIERVSVGM